MAKDNQYDLIAIGGGSAGLTVTTIAARLGAKVLLVDKERLGGDCLHYGCVPSKALIASARMAHRMRHAEKYGISPVDVKVDVTNVMKRIQQIKDDVGSHETPEIFREMGADVMFGGASFIDEHTLEIGGTERVYRRPDRDLHWVSCDQPANPRSRGNKKHQPCQSFSSRNPSKTIGCDWRGTHWL